MNPDLALVWRDAIDWVTILHAACAASGDSATRVTTVVDVYNIGIDNRIANASRVILANRSHQICISTMRGEELSPDVTRIFLSRAEGGTTAIGAAPSASVGHRDKGSPSASDGHRDNGSPSASVGHRDKGSPSASVLHRDNGSPCHSWLAVVVLPIPPERYAPYHPYSSALALPTSPALDRCAEPQAPSWPWPVFPTPRRCVPGWDQVPYALWFPRDEVWPSFQA